MSALQPREPHFPWCQAGLSNFGLQDVVVGRPRDGDDRVAWLLQRGRFREALAIAGTDRSLRKHNRAQVPAGCQHPKYEGVRPAKCCHRHHAHKQMLAVRDT